MILSAVFALVASLSYQELPYEVVAGALEDVDQRTREYASQQASLLGLGNWEVDYCLARTRIITDMARSNGSPPFDDIFLASSEEQLGVLASRRLRFQQFETVRCLRDLARRD